MVNVDGQGQSEGRETRRKQGTEIERLPAYVFTQAVIAGERKQRKCQAAGGRGTLKLRGSRHHIHTQNTHITSTKCHLGCLFSWDINTPGGGNGWEEKEE